MSQLCLNFHMYLYAQKHVQIHAYFVKVGHAFIDIGSTIYISLFTSGELTRNPCQVTILHG
jgi:hypothetical protein